MNDFNAEENVSAAVKEMMNLKKVIHSQKEYKVEGILANSTLNNYNGTMFGLK